jgi:hypothetical protein
MTTELSRRKCDGPECVNEVPPHRDRFCSDGCLKAYSAVETSKLRWLRTLRGYVYAPRASHLTRMS